MRYVKLICGILMAGIAYFTMFLQFLFYSDDSISMWKLIIRGLICLFFLFIGIHLILAFKKRAHKKNNT